jgi:hypothetical protein
LVLTARPLVLLALVAAQHIKARALFESIAADADADQGVMC